MDLYLDIETDLALIRQAKRMSCTQWSEVSDMRNKATFAITKDRLKAISSHYYHREEYNAGLD